MHSLKFFLNLFFGCTGSLLPHVGFSLAVTSLVVVCGLLIEVAFFVAGHGL